MSIADYFANLGNPQERKRIFNNAIGIKSPTKGTMPKQNKSAPFLSFADQRRKSADTLAVEAGFKPAVVEEDTYVPGADPAQVFRSTLLGGGLPEHVVDGIMMNAQDESGFNPAVYGDNGAAVGILQWNGPRQKALKSFADANGMAYNDPALQAKFTLHELQTSERGAYESLMRTASAGEAGAVFVNQFERPAEQHRRAREAKYLGGGTGDFTNYSSGLSFGEELSEPNPLADEYIGRSATNYSMGMDDEKFQSLREKYGENKAMEILNSQGLYGAQSQMPYDDPIMRFLQEGAEEVAPVLPNGGANPGLTGPGGLSMGVTVADGTPAASTTGGGGGTAPGATASTKTTVEEDKPKVTAVDRMMNAIYGTSVEDMDDDERADRRRAVGLAMAQGFQMLSRGTPMDLQPIVTQRMELQQARRASQELKQNAQGVSDMLVAAGMEEMAQLPFMGENGMNAALQTLATVATRESGDATFDLPPATRAAMAQTLYDAGQGGLAEQFLNPQLTGDGLKQLYDTTLGIAGREPASGDGGAWEPQKQEAAARIARSMGNEPLAMAIEDGVVSPTDTSKYFFEVGKATGVSDVNAAADAEAAAAYAKAAADSGLVSPEIADAASRAGTPDAARAIVTAAETATIKAEENKKIKERGEAVAKLVPNSLPNAEELRTIARTAQTSQDLTPVYAAVAGQNDIEQLYRLSQKDEGFMPFYMETLRAQAGQGKPRTFAEDLNLNSITARFTLADESRTSRKTAVDNATLIKQTLANPRVTTGMVQGALLIPAQKCATSIMGENAPQFATPEDVTAAKLFDVSKAQAFVSASMDLAGAISEMETKQFLATASTITDTKMAGLVNSQFTIKKYEIQEAEENAILEWTSYAEKNGISLGDRENMLAYVKEKTKGMEVFEKVTVGTPEFDAWFDDPSRVEGDVVLVRDESGNMFYESFTLN
jgi:hypothetical protein